MEKNSRQEQVLVWRFLFIATLGAWVLVAVAGLYLILRPQVLSFQATEEAVSSEKSVSADEGLHPKSISISSLGIDLPISSATILTDGTWEVSEDGVSHLQHSRLPGMGGNVVVYGHNTTTLLGSLASITDGAVITITTENGQQFSYQVANTQTVSPETISVVAPTETEVLTLYTCAGWFDSQRFVVQAKPVFADAQ